MQNELEKEKKLVNPKYTFNNFVVGENNKFAYKLALSIANEPAKLYNPLFLYGEVGLGKTHLMCSIKNKILKDNKDMNVLYVTSQEFTNELIDSIKENKMKSFRDKYKNIDILLIDDIQFIAGKERIQEEVFYVFDDLYENGKQIVISSDKVPRNIYLLEDRLKFRFESGVVAKISSYDYETRLEILRKHAQEFDVIIDDKILEVIAKKVTSNVRELKGVINTLYARSNLLDEPISIDMVNKVISELEI